jgi:hypothetical protein
VGRRRSRALALALVVWFVAIVLFDVAALGLASLLRSGPASRVLIVSVLVNPADAVRTGALLGLQGTTAFGSASLAFLRFTKGPVGAAGPSPVVQPPLYRTDSPVQVRQVQSFNERPHRTHWVPRRDRSVQPKLSQLHLLPLRRQDPGAPALTLVLGLLFEHEEICAFLITLSSRVPDFFTGSQAKWRSRRNHR